MCLGLPAKLVEFADDRPDMAVAEVSGVRRRVSTALLDDLELGDWVLIHVGFAMAKIDEDEAAAALKLFEELGEAAFQE